MDGNTTQGASPREVPENVREDVSMLERVFANVRDSVINASELGTQVQALRRELEGLKADTEAQRRRNQELDEALTTVRSQRDEAREDRRQVSAKLDETTHALERTQTERDQIKAQYEAKAQDYNDAQNELRQTYVDLRHSQDEAKDWESKYHAKDRERDDQELRAMAAEERATVAEGRLKAIQEAMEKAAAAFLVQPAEEPKAPQPGESGTQSGESTASPDTVASSQPGTPQAEITPAPEAQPDRPWEAWGRG